MNVELDVSILQEKKEKEMWTLKQLFEWNTKTCINDKWVPARPENWKYRSFIVKTKEAWSVFTGKADCFMWPEGQ